MEQRTDLLEIIEHINPGQLDYQEWVNVGMALKHEGYSVSVWDAWSKSDSGRYHKNECNKKWNSFHGTSSPVTGGTLVQMAIGQGWKPSHNIGHELEWDDEISFNDEHVIVDKNWIEAKEVVEPVKWDPVKELITYIETLFGTDDLVGYATRTWEKEGKLLPDRGCWDRTARQLIQQLEKCKGDIGSVLGDYNPKAGAWIRFNPVDGKGKSVTNENVTEFRYALVESDDTEIEQQNAIIRELELPVACLVHSGNKSLHAIVHVDAINRDEYRKRVDYLYDICKKNGLKVDGQNRNPSRLSRMPGIMRNGQKQFLIDTNIGKESWSEWYEWIESVNDDLPEPEALDSVWDDLPELSPPLIDGILRQGHKMLIAGPSKAGKSFALIELCIGLAEGRSWLRWSCTRGRVMYVNLELDRASCLHRFKDVYNALGYEPNHLNNIDIWNLRGKSVPMDKLAPKLIRRAAKKNYIAIVIDPIYKVITGDENSADQMAAFCNQFDKVCTELGTAVIYCHHHSKGGQGNKKSMDRASGSGVFARDPDALLDLIELETTDEMINQEINKALCDTCVDYLNHLYDDWEDDVSQDDMCSQIQMLAYCKKKLTRDQSLELVKRLEAAEKNARMMTAWRIEGTLREFPKFEPVNVWFDYPIHKHDTVGVLKDIELDDSSGGRYKKNFGKKKSPDDAKKDRAKALEVAFEACGIDEKITVKAMSEFMAITEKTVRNRIKEHGGFWIDEGIVGKK
ncbi:MAG: AAA family ATPase [Lachnospiraceae bacterium]